MKTRVSLKYPVNACWLALVSGKIKPPWPNAHSDKLIYVGSRSTRKCLLLKWVEFHLDIQKTICYKILNWCHYQSDHLKNTNPAADDRFTFHSFSYSKLVSATIYSFTKIKLFKIMKNTFCFSKALDDLWFKQNKVQWLTSSTRDFLPANEVGQS